MALAGKQSAVTVDGNTISNGRFTNGTSNFTYSYDGCISSSADTVITNNFLTGVSGAGTYPMIFLNGGNCLISNNKFVRDGASIYSYITDGSGKDQIVVDNSFDSDTIDGTTTALVRPLSVNSIYERNKNQAQSKQIKILHHFYHDYAVPFGAAFPGFSPGRLYSTSFNNSAYEVFLNQSGSPSVTTHVRASFDLDEYLPPNVKIVNIVLGYHGNQYLELSPGSTVTMSLTKTASSSVDFSSPPASFASSLADVYYGFNTATRGLLSGAGNTTTTGALAITPFSNTATQYAYLNISDADNYITGKNFNNHVLIDFSLIQSGSFSAMFHHVFVVKYKYI